MRYNQLGNTGLFVSEICLGTMTFGPAGENGQWGSIASLGQDGVDQIVGRSVAAGVNFFDTADVYSFGKSEELLGQSIRNFGLKRENVILATKVHGTMGEGPNQRGSSRGHIMDSVEGSLKRLQTDHIDLYQLHGTDTVTPIEETLRALDDLVCQRQGALCRRLQLAGLADRQGAGNFRAQGFCAFRDDPVLLFDCRPRPRTRDRAADQRGEARPDGVVADGRRAVCRANTGPARRATARAAAPTSISRLSTRIAPGLRLPRCARSPPSTMSASRRWRSATFWPSLS